MTISSADGETLTSTQCKTSTRYFQVGVKVNVDCFSLVPQKQEIQQTLSQQLLEKQQSSSSTDSTLMILWNWLASMPLDNLIRSSINIMVVLFLTNGSE